jgi:hypothetical protein
MVPGTRVSELNSRAANHTDAHIVIAGTIAMPSWQSCLHSYCQYEHTRVPRYWQSCLRHVWICSYVHRYRNTHNKHLFPMQRTSKEEHTTSQEYPGMIIGRPGPNNGNGQFFARQILLSSITRAIKLGSECEFSCGTRYPEGRYNCL